MQVSWRGGDQEKDDGATEGGGKRRNAPIKVKRPEGEGRWGTLKKD